MGPFRENARDPRQPDPDDDSLAVMNFFGARKRHDFGGTWENANAELSLPLHASVTANSIRLQLVHPPQATDLLKVFPMILRARNIGFHVLRESLGTLRMIDVELQMVRVEVIVLENCGWMGPIGLVHNRFNPVTGNDGLLRVPLNVFSGDQLFGDDDDSLTRLGLLFIFPASAMNLGVPLVVSNLDMNEGNIGVQRSQEQVLFTRKRTLHALHIFCSRSILQPFQNFGGQQGFDGDERKSQGPGQIAKAYR